MRSDAPKLIYIAGRFNAQKGAPVESNIRAAEELARTLVHFYPEAQPVVPHSLGRVLFGVQTEEAAYAGTLELMRRCDALLLVDGWHDSKGTTDERAEALSRGMPVFEEGELFSQAGEQPRFHRWLESGR